MYVRQTVIPGLGLNSVRLGEFPNMDIATKICVYLVAIYPYSFDALNTFDRFISCGIAPCWSFICGHFLSLLVIGFYVSTLGWLYIYICMCL